MSVEGANVICDADVFYIGAGDPLMSSVRGIATNVATANDMRTQIGQQVIAEATRLGFTLTSGNIRQI